MEACCSRFTPAEGGTRLAAAASDSNILAVEYASFIATRLVHEHGYKIRGSLLDGKQRSVYVTRASRVACVAYELQILTDLVVTQAKEYQDVDNWHTELDKKEIIVCTSRVLQQILHEQLLTMLNINVLILDSCHAISTDKSLQYIMNSYKMCEKDNRPRILALTYPLFNLNIKDTIETDTVNEDKIEPTIDEVDVEKVDIMDKEETIDKADVGDKVVDIVDTDDISEEKTENKEVEIEDSKKDPEIADVEAKTKAVDETLEIGVYENLDDFDMYEKLEWKIEEMENELCCQMDLAEDIDGGKRISSTVAKPKELIIEYNAQTPIEELPEAYKELDKFMRDTVNDALAFLDDHRYDPTEIYGDDLYDEIKNIPDPTIEPRHILKQFLYVLDQLGPYAADKAAFSLLNKLDKLKLKIPYERHFLLLCLCVTVFVKIAFHADNVFSKYDDNWEKIQLFSTPKVLRLAEILEKFDPPDCYKDAHKSLPEKKSRDTDATQIKNKADIDSETSNASTKLSQADRLLSDLQKCDFKTLGNRIEDKVNIIEGNLKDLDVPLSEENIYDITDSNVKNNVNEDDITNIVDIELENSSYIKKEETPSVTATTNQADINVNENSPEINDDEANNEIEQDKDTNDTFSDNNNIPEIEQKNNEEMKQNSKAEGTQKLGPKKVHRIRGRGRVQRNNATRVQQMQMNPDALCGIVFVKEPLIAKIMFLVIVDMSRAYSKLSYLCAQYCAVETPADPGTELKECQRQGKKQEDVLKKFRMHDCNLLLATAVLEEGIDLPRCNLVLRWDSPPSYRSYGLCRARARAPRAACALLCEHGTHALLHNLATYKELDQIITRKCGCGIQNEPPPKEEDDADHYTSLVVPYTPAKQTDRLGESNEIERDVTKNVDDVENMNDILKEISDVSLYLRESVSCDNLRIDGRTKSDINVNITALSNVEVSERNVNMCRNVGNTKNSVDINDRTKKNSVSEIASVDLNTAIALINRYCGKLPSDTFTRLAPQWWMEEVQLPVRGSGQKRTAYICTLKLPLNCPVKYNIVGHPMPDRVLARRMVALQACRILHKSGELDNQLMPIGKENFKAVELENGYNLDLLDPNDLARPGTTKRRQYYFKRTAWAFTDCQPVVDTSDSEIENPTGHKENSEKRDVKNGKRNMLYAIVSSLWCALPERYNTRGRRLHAPQHAQQAIGILMARHEPDRLQIPSFPVYTRSGEVRVSVEHVPGADVRVSPRRGHLVRRFMRFVFSEVLRVRRRGMKLQNEGSTHNNYYIVPTIKIETEDGYTKTDIDWAFLELIYQHTEQKKQCGIEKPILLPEDQEEDAVEKNVKKEKGEVKKMENPLLKPGETFVFDADRYREAVVTPWYRNQDQPQYFLVAEICWNLSPDSAFPSATHTSFRHYYSHKYGVELTQPNQPLLDVDHTSARLNLLTPRYVNRKGVALPVSSERTRRAKRDRLDQKQILVPELCTVHPFAAPLWFATVSLPCVLYRINALLIADEIRRAVAIDVGLGIPKIDDTSSPGFQWPPLDFGWSLSEVLNAEYEKSDKKKEDEEDIAETIEDQDDSEEEEDVKEKTINDILQEKEDAENSFEIGTWSNDMASSVPDAPYDELLEPLPPNLTLCTSASGGTNWCDPVPKPKNQFNPSRSYFSMADSDCSYMTSDFDTDDSDLDSEGSDEDDDLAGFCRSKNSNAAMGVRIEYKTAHEAEAVDVERNRKRNVAPQPDAGDDIEDRKLYARLLREGDAPERYKEKFRRAVDAHKQEIVDNGLLIEKDSPIHEILPQTKDHKTIKSLDTSTDDKFMELFPYQADSIKLENNQVSLEDIEKNKRVLLAELKKSMPEEEIKKLNCFSMIDVDIDSPDYVNEKVVNVGFDTKELYEEKVKCGEDKSFTPYYLDNKCQNGKEFDFDYQPSLEGHPGPSPSVILQALTMSNANDGINLERLETIGDSFLKFAITAYLYCAHPTVHEGKLSHMRSKQVSNLNLYRLGRNRRLGARMIASKFEPHDNWLPPCHRPPPTLHPRTPGDSVEVNSTQEAAEGAGCFIPYNLITQHSIPDKSIADCVEALIGAYLLECGPRGALLFMSWLGIRVLPLHLLPLPENHPYSSEDKNAQTQEPSGSRKCPSPSPSVSSGEAEGEMGADGDEEEWRHQQLYPEQDWSWRGRAVGSLRPCTDSAGRWVQPIFGELKAPPSPLLRYIEDPEGELEQMLSGYEALERTLQYRFKDRSLLLQALTHASHHNNRLTDCYQRLEFLGDAILDYLITRHLYEDPRRHSPGALTDLRSALVNNTIFATLAARHGFHKYFRHMSPGLNEVLTKYVRIQEENGHSISEEHYLIQEDEMEQAEDVEVPKALGDLFESVAGAIFLDSGMSLGAVWRSYVSLMGAELEAFSAAAPKSPVRELLEAEPDTAKFGKPERLADGRRVRVCVEVFGRGSFKGIGRNYRIAKGTAARCALRHLRLHR